MACSTHLEFGVEVFTVGALDTGAGHVRVKSLFAGLALCSATAHLAILITSLALLLHGQELFLSALVTTLSIEGGPPAQSLFTGVTGETVTRTAVTVVLALSAGTVFEESTDHAGGMDISGGTGGSHGITLGAPFGVSKEFI